MQDLISIIVPVYNAAEYLSCCINSILNQTHHNLEIILVNDGSTDGSDLLCDEFAKTDKRVQVIHQANKGVSATRNAGLDAASGKWIGFVDSDDRIEPEMYEKLLSAAVDNDCEISICGFIKYHLNGWDEKRICSDISKVLNRNKALEYALRNTHYEGYVCNKLFKHCLIKTIRFDETLHACEDLVFTTQAFMNTDHVTYVNSALYHYMVRENSSISTFNDKRLTGLVAREFVIKNAGEISENLRKLAQIQYMHYSIGLLYEVARTDITNKKIFILRKSSLRYSLIYFLSNQVSLKMKMRSIAIIGNPRLAYKLWKLMKKVIDISWWNKSRY